MSTIQDATILKIKKLLALSRSSNEHEAALAASRAQELLFKHKIEMATVESAIDPKHVTNNAVSETFDYAPKGKRNQAWRTKLLNSVAMNNFCKVVIIGGGELKNSCIIGTKSDIEIVTYLFSYLTCEIDRLAKDSGKRARERFMKTGEHVDPFRWYMSFCDGAQTEVHWKLVEQRMKDERDTPTETMALVKRDDQQAEDKMNQMFPSLRKMKTTAASRDYQANSEGHAAGKDISLRRGLGEGKQGRID